MSSRLSSLLVQDGLVSAQRVADALKRQVISGGNIDTNLLEMKALEEDRLLTYLGRACGLPTQPTGIGAAGLPKPEVLELFTQALAERFHAVPSALLPAGVLQVLVTDDVEITEMDALAQQVQQRIEPWVVLEFRFAEAMDKVYGVGLPKRFARLLERSLQAHEGKGWPPPSLIDPIPRFGSLSNLRLVLEPPRPPEPVAPPPPVAVEPVIAAVAPAAAVEAASPTPVVEPAVVEPVTVKPAVVEPAEAPVAAAPVVVEPTPAVVESVPPAQSSPASVPVAAEAVPGVIEPTAVTPPAAAPQPAIAAAAEPAVPAHVAFEPTAPIAAAPPAPPEVKTEHPPELLPTVMVDPSSLGFEKRAASITSATASNVSATGAAPASQPASEPGRSSPSQPALDNLSMDDWMSMEDWLSVANKLPPEDGTPSGRSPSRRTPAPASMTPTGKMHAQTGLPVTPRPADSAAPSAPLEVETSSIVAVPTAQPAPVAQTAASVTKQAAAPEPTKPSTASPQAAEAGGKRKGRKNKGGSAASPPPAQTAAIKPAAATATPAAKPAQTQAPAQVQAQAAAAKPPVAQAATPMVAPTAAAPEKAPAAAPIATPTLPSKPPVPAATPVAAAKPAQTTSKPPTSGPAVTPKGPAPSQPGAQAPASTPAVAKGPAQTQPTAQAQTAGAKGPAQTQPTKQQPGTGAKDVRPTAQAAQAKQTPVESRTTQPAVETQRPAASAQVSTAPRDLAEPRPPEPRPPEPRPVEKPVPPVFAQPSTAPTSEPLPLPLPLSPSGRVSRSGTTPVPAAQKPPAAAPHASVEALPEPIPEPINSGRLGEPIVSMPPQPSVTAQPVAAEPEISLRPPRVAIALDPAGSSPLSPEAARELIGDTSDYDVIYGALCRGARSRVAFAAVLTVHGTSGEVALGRTALESDWHDRAQIGRVSIPLDRPSIFQSVAKDRAPVVGARDDQAGTRDALRSLGRTPPLPLALLPIVVRGKTAALLYLDDGGRELPSDLAEDLNGLLGDVTQAIARLTQASKTGGLGATAEATDGVIAAPIAETGTSAWGSPQRPGRRSSGTTPTPQVAAAPVAQAAPVAPATPAAPVAAVPTPAPVAPASMAQPILPAPAAATPGPTAPRPVDSVLETTAPMLSDEALKTPRRPEAQVVSVAPQPVPPSPVPQAVPVAATEQPTTRLRVEKGKKGKHGREQPAQQAAKAAQPPAPTPPAPAAPAVPAAISAQPTAPVAAGKPASAQSPKGGTAAKPALSELVAKASLQDEQAASALLAGGEEAVRAVVAALPGPARSGEPQVGGGAALYGRPLLALTLRMGPAAVEPVIQRLRDAATPAKTRYFLALCLGEVPVAAAMAPLGERLFDADDEVRAAAAAALRNFPASKQLASLLDKLRGEIDHSDPKHQSHAVEALGELRDTHVIPRLIELLGHSDPSLVDAAGRALQTLTKQDFGRSRWRWGGWWRRQKDQPRLQWLLAGLGHSSALVRSSAQEELLGMSGDVAGYRFDQPRRERDMAARRWAEWWQRRGFGVM